MGGKVRSASEKAYDRMKIAELNKAGLSQEEIAEELKISQPTVSRDLAYLERQWAARANQLTEEKQNLILAELDWVREEAKDAFKRSKKVAVTAKGIVRAGKSEFAGDPRFLDVVQRAVHEVIEMLGLKEATAIKLSPEALALLTVLGVDKAQVVKAFEAILREQAQLEGKA